MQLEQLLKKTRTYFWDLGFDEVEIPYLNSSLPLEPNLYAFQTQDFYLPTSPEFALKNHLAKYKKHCFAVAHCFRDLEAEGPHHTKEFLMLEYYLVNKNLIDLQKSLQDYISQFIRNLKFEIRNLPTNLPNNEPDFNQYFLNEIEPNLPKNAVFVTGYPAFLSPLAEPNQRFELYINGIEIANGCVENRNPDSIRQSFIKEQSYRQKNNLPTHPYSEKFITDSALLPPCSGVGLGLERFLTILNNKQS